MSNNWLAGPINARMAELERSVAEIRAGHVQLAEGLGKLASMVQLLSTAYGRLLKAAAPAETETESGIIIADKVPEELPK